MHRSFCVLPHQIEVMEQEYERAIYPYFREAIQILQRESLQVSSDWMSRLSLLAEENNAWYESYQNELNAIEIVVQKYKNQVRAQRSMGTTHKYVANKAEEDETSIISLTEHSSDYEDDDSEHVLSPKEEGGTGGFLKVAWLFRTPAATTATVTTTPTTPTTVQTTSSSSSSMGTLSDSIHGKSRVVFQIAATKLQLPFT